MEPIHQKYEGEIIVLMFKCTEISHIKYNSPLQFLFTIIKNNMHNSLFSNFLSTSFSYNTFQNQIHRMICFIKKIIFRYDSIVCYYNSFSLQILGFKTQGGVAFENPSYLKEINGDSTSNVSI